MAKSPKLPMSLCKSSNDGTTNIYQRLNVPYFVNAYEYLTRYGGAVMSQEAIDAIVEASRFGTVLSELQERIGLSIAHLTNNEAAYVCCGASSGITLCVAACMTGVNDKLSRRLPDTTGMKNEVVMHEFDRRYKCETAVRCSGARVVAFGRNEDATEQECEAAIGPATAAMLYAIDHSTRKVPLNIVVRIAQEKNIPVIVDAAGAVPPKESLWKFTREMGVDAAVVSGGKGLRGPQSSGLVLGTKAMIAGCVHNGVPNTRIGRGMKVGKEEMAGLYAAVIQFLKTDECLEQAMRKGQADYLMEVLSDLSEVSATRVSATQINISYDRNIVGVEYGTAVRRFLSAKPGVLLHCSEAGLQINTATLNNGEEQIVGARLREFFEVPSARRSQMVVEPVSAKFPQLHHEITRTVVLSDSDRASVRNLALKIVSDEENLIETQFLDRAALFAHELPITVRKAFYEFKSRETSASLLIRNNPIVPRDVGPTPSTHWRPGEYRPLNLAQIVHGLYSSLLGEPFGFETQQNGRVFNDLIPIHGHEANSSSGRGDIGMHTEDAFQPFAPDYLGFLCLRNVEGAKTVLSSLAHANVPDRMKRLLFEPRFAPKQKSHFGASPCQPILFGDPSYPYLRYGPIDKEKADEQMLEAMRVVTRALAQGKHTLVLSQGDCLYIDNFIAVHGRVAYTPCYGPTGRWLCRLVMARDLRVTRTFRRTASGRVMVRNDRRGIP